MLRWALLLVAAALLLIPSAAAAEDESVIARFADSRNGLSFTLDATPTGANAGAFSLFVPGEGLHWPDGPASIKPLSDGGLLVTYHGDAWVDATAQWPSPIYLPSGSQEPTSITLVISVTADLQSASGVFFTSVWPRTFVSAKPTLAAEPAIDAALNELAASDWDSLYARFIDAFRDSLDVDSFAAAMDRGVMQHGDIVAVERLADATVTDAGSGQWFAAAPFEVTFELDGVRSTHESAIAMLYEQSEWRIYTIDPIGP